MTTTNIILPNSITYSGIGTIGTVEDLRADDQLKVTTNGGGFGGSSNLLVRVNFEPINGILSGQQSLTVKADSSYQSMSNIILSLYQNGSLIKKTTIAGSLSEAEYTLTFDSTELTDTSGSGIEFEMEGESYFVDKGGGTGSWAYWSYDYVYFTASTGKQTTIAPNVPTNLSPISNTTLTTRLPLFSATLTDDEPNDSIILVVQYSQDSTFLSGVTTIQSGSYVLSGGTGSVSPSSPLQNGTWYWRAKARDSGGLESTYTESYIVIIDNKPPNIPTNLSPANNTVVTTNSFTFSADLSDPELDEVVMVWEVSTVKDFSSIHSSGTDTTSPFSVTLQNLSQGNYYWRVKSRDSLSGQESAYTSIRGIFVDIPATGRLSPDSISTSSGFSSGATLTNIDEDPDTPDSYWAITNIQSNSTMRVSFPSPPSGGLKIGAGLQEFRVRLRNSESALSGAYAIIRLYESGTLKTSSTNILPQTTTGSVFSFTWDASILSNQTGLNVECHIDIYGVSSGRDKGTLDLGSIEWNYTINSETQDPAPEVSFPTPTITSISDSKISDESGKNISTVKFTFDIDVSQWTVNVVGTSWDTGTVAHSFTGNVISGTECIAQIDWTELYQEGDNRVNIYGKSLGGTWTPYNI